MVLQIVICISILIFKKVTCLSWNPKYNDLFAAGFGSFNFYNQEIKIFNLHIINSTCI